jgi:DNA repair protein RecN (Recombination protein N)|tara:strand:- start:29871 stop:31547 length:1677 start_codon:yes stop_codon:yes gene_type:complete
MLSNLTVKNFTLVNQLNLSLERGMTAITGETGAGKSILLDALSLTLGDRADYSRIRKGADRAEVAAQFEIEGSDEAKAWLINHQLDSDGECLLRRAITVKGKSSAWINGQMVTLTQLRELAEMLISIHSQHEHQALTKSAHHRQLLDQFADHKELLDTTSQSFDAWSDAAQRVKQLQEQFSEGQERLELIRFQVQELTLLNVEENEFNRLEEEQKILANAESILATLASLMELLEENQNVNIQTALQQSLILLEKLPVKTESVTEAEAMLKSSAIQIEEATTSIRNQANGTELDPKRLASVEDRISQIFHVARKYRKEPEDLNAFCVALEEELQNLNDPEAALQQAKILETESLDLYLSEAKSLNLSRSKAAKNLESEVNSHFDSLSMKGAEIRFKLNFNPDAIRNRWGADEIQLLVRTNPGQDHGAISKIASGGELSRISLAIQVVTARSGQTPTLIFDEVDVGIGGATAHTVGNMLQSLGERAQIICITHLAQVASKAGNQLRVSKETLEDSALSQIEVLDKNSRVEEIARMLGGAEVSKRSRDNAREMLRLEDEV